MLDTKPLVAALAVTGLPAGPLAEPRRFWAAGNGARHRLHDSRYCGTTRLHEASVTIDDPRLGCSRCGTDLVVTRGGLWAKAVLAAAEALAAVEGFEQTAGAATPATLPGLRQRCSGVLRDLAEHGSALRRAAASTVYDGSSYEPCVVPLDDLTENLRGRIARLLEQAQTATDAWVGQVATQVPAALAADLAAVEVAGRVRAGWPDTDWDWGTGLLAGRAAAAVGAWTQALGGTLAERRLDTPLTENPSMAAAEQALRAMLDGAPVAYERSQYPGVWLTAEHPGEDPFCRIEREWRTRTSAASDALLQALDESAARYRRLEGEQRVVVVVGPLPLHRGGAVAGRATVLATDADAKPFRRVLVVSGLEAAWLAAWGGHGPAGQVVQLGSSRQTGPDGGVVEVDEAVAGLFLRLWPRDGRGPLAEPAEALALAVATAG